MPAPTPTRAQTQLARTILTRNLRVRPGENVVIEGWSHSLPWAIALARETRRLKAYPLVLYEDERTFWDSVEAREEDVLGAAPAHEWAMLGKTDVYIHMWGAGDRLRIAALGGDRAEKLIGFNSSWYAAAHKAGLRGARLEVGRPFPNLAQLYGKSESKWVRQLVAASMVDPARLSALGKPIASALQRGRRLRIRDDSGTDLTLGLAHRPARVAAGQVNRSDLKQPFQMLSGLPSGGVRVALDERVADGKIVANRPCYYDTGMAQGGVFEFRRGRLVRHHFESGGKLFEDGFRRGGAGRDRPGLLSIGLNPKLHDTPQVEDLEVGAIMVSVGGNRFFPGGKNMSPFFGFVINRGARVEIDGRPLKLPG
ncbi:MAG: aminopeptidase [Thermoplasmata archaeon]